VKKKFEIFKIHNIVNPRNTMTPMELKDYIDFDVKRIYYVTDPKTDAGVHCHFEEKELFIMIQGQCTAIIDQGNGLEDVILKGPSTAIYVPNYVWHGFKDFSSDAVLLALTSTNYRPDRSDYLEDYNEYLKIRDEKLKD
jgi:dTDP-4-dehydrorhamnose 3,5-epimerase-like enzyme